tara:strand:- start:509 stop:1219 length:711 start_codon:yes stop_codon:yes gene_type:complete
MNTENLDHDEVNKFDELATRWWDTEGEFKPLHQINPLRVGFIRERCELNGKKILDVGCGGGILSEALSSLGAKVTGIDASDNTIGVAMSHSKKVGSNVKFLKNTIEEFKSSHPEEKFDVITCLEMLEHVPSPADIVKICSEMLEDGGDIFFSTINRNPRSYLFAILGAEYILNLLPKGTHDYEKFIKPSELAKWIRGSDLSSKETVGLSYNPITGNYWLGKDIQVNYMVHAKKDRD